MWWNFLNNLSHLQKEKILFFIVPIISIIIGFILAIIGLITVIKWIF